MVFWANAYFSPAVEYDNSISRFFLLSAVVDFHQLNIDPFINQTIDKSVYNGKYYSNKAIGSPLIAIPVYTAARWLFKSRQDQPLNWPSRYIVTLLTTSLVGALCSLLMWRLALRWGAEPPNALLMVSGFSFGSIFWVNATMFSGHVMAAFLFFLGFYLVWMVKEEGGRKHPMLVAFAAGVCAGLAGLCDYTAIFLDLVLAVYVLISKIKRREKVLFFLGAAGCAVLLLLYNWKCFGSFLSTSYQHNAFESFAKGSRSGFMGISFPDPAALALLLFSPARGLFFIMPVTLFGLFGLIHLYRQTNRRAEFWLAAGVILCNLLVNAGFYGWHGGWTVGPRYLTVMLPFLFFTMAFVPLRNRYFFLLLVISFLQVFLAVAYFPYTPESIHNPVLEISIPLIRDGYQALNLGLLCGMSQTISLIFWFAILMAFIGLLFHLVRRIPAGTLSSGRKAMVVLLASLICILFFTVHTDSGTIEAYRSRLLLDYYKSPIHKMMLDQELDLDK